MGYTTVMSMWRAKKPNRVSDDLPRGLVMTAYCDMSGSDVARAGDNKPRAIKWEAADPL